MNNTISQAQYNPITGESRKDQIAPRIYTQEDWVNNFAQQLPLGATFAPHLTAWDENDGDLSDRIVTLSAVNTGLVGSYLAQYEVTDNGLPSDGGFPSWGPNTTTFSLPVTIYDPTVGVPSEIQNLGNLWQEPPMTDGLLILAPGEKLSRNIRIASVEHPLTGDELQINIFHVQEGYWGGNNRQFSLSLTDIASGEKAYDGSIAFSSGTLLTPVAPITVRADRNYEFTLTYLAGPDSQGFRPNEKGELWLTADGLQEFRLNPYAQVWPDPENTLAFDPGLSNAVKQKLLSTGDGQEALLINKVPGHNPVTLSYRIANPLLASMQVVSGDTQDKLVFQGLATGETWVDILAGGVIIEQVRLYITTPKNLTLSYSYIAFPDERQSHLWSDGVIIMADMSRRLAPYNIEVNWVDHGVLVYEWDKNGDGSSYDTERIEIEAPITEGWIPNADQVFSNIYVMRHNKNDAQACSSSGGGSSIGFGAEERGPRAAYRAACPGNAAVYGQSLTLTHELGHNLGLWHTDDEERYRDSNYMTAGRFEGVFFANQWRTIHQTIAARIAAGDPGVSETKSKG